MTSEVTENKTSDETERNELNENKDVGENGQSSPIKKKNNSVRSTFVPLELTDIHWQLNEMMYNYCKGY